VDAMYQQFLRKFDARVEVVGVHGQLFCS
jgi:hypothetical protein